MIEWVMLRGGETEVGDDSCCFLFRSMCSLEVGMRASMLLSPPTWMESELRELWSEVGRFLGDTLCLSLADRLLWPEEFCWERQLSQDFFDRLGEERAELFEDDDDSEPKLTSTFLISLLFRSGMLDLLELLEELELEPENPKGK